MTPRYSGVMTKTTDPYPWRHWPQYGSSEVLEVRFATQSQAIAYGATAAVWAPRDGGAE